MLDERNACYSKVMRKGTYNEQLNGLPKSERRHSRALRCSAANPHYEGINACSGEVKDRSYSEALLADIYKEKKGALTFWHNDFQQPLIVTGSRRIERAGVKNRG